MGHLRVTEYTDPGCPFAFSAEKFRWRLEWLYGSQLDWSRRMVVLSRDPSDYEEGHDPRQAGGALQAAPP